MLSVTLVAVILAYLMYTPTDPLKALFAGLTATVLLNSADQEAFKGEK